MKTYSAPRLVEIGSVVERTQGAFPGGTDGGENIVLAVGSVGFNL
jgi:hypothetical protein